MDAGKKKIWIRGQVIEVTDEVYTAYMKGDRKIRYFENDLKTERTVKDKDGNIKQIFPSREDSLDRLMEDNAQQFSDSHESVEDIVKMNILLEILAGETSVLYSRLFEQGLINTSFSKEYFVGSGYEAVIFDGESTDAKAVCDAIKAEVARLKKEGIGDRQFEAARRSLYGKEIMSYNVTDTVANGMIASYFAGFGIFDSLKAYERVTKEDVEKILAEKLDEKYSALSVVKSEE